MPVGDTCVYCVGKGQGDMGILCFLDKEEFVFRV